MDAERNEGGRRGRWPRRALLSLAGALLLFLFVEGCASFVLLTRAVAGERGLAERRHTRHDPELGWANEPGVRVPDLYGPGRSLTIDAHGFRGTRVLAREVPPGKVRLVCAGDSFTLGYGVDDDETWCAGLEARDPRLETVNMGQGGYGVDQAYLWYRRDGALLEHDVLLFAFITADFRRMLQESFQGYGKPRLVLRDGAPVVEGVPVPEPGRLRAFLLRHRVAVRELALVQLVAGGKGETPARDPRSVRQREGRAPEELVEAILVDLARLCAERGSRLVLVHLPMYDDCAERLPPATALWRRIVGTLAERHGIASVDLLDAFCDFDGDPRELYLAAGEVDYPGAAGHYSVAGNARVAELLRAELGRLPATRELLSR